MATSMAGSPSHPANPFLPAPTPTVVTGTGVPVVTSSVTTTVMGLSGVSARPLPTGTLVTAGQAALGPSAMIGLSLPAMTYAAPGTTVSAVSAPLVYGSTGIGGTNVSTVNTPSSSWSIPHVMGHSLTTPASQGGLYPAHLPSYGQWVVPRPGSAAGSVTTPLVSAMDPTGAMTDPATDVVAKGIILRPEYHVQHVIGDVPIKNISHKTLSYSDLVLGMCCIAKYLLSSSGNVSSYLSLMSFIARQAHLDCFIDATFVEYDRVVTDAVIRGDIATYIPGYPLAQALAFHSANHKPQSGKSKGKWVQAKRNKSNIANEVCYNYNFHLCEGCERLHVCKQCRANHKFMNCPTKTKDQQ